MLGTVKKLMDTKMFGFIQGENGNQYFFHRKDFLGHWEDLCADFQRGDEIKVEFAAVNNAPKGPRAENVGRIDHPNMSR